MLVNQTKLNSFYVVCIKFMALLAVITVMCGHMAKAQMAETIPEVGEDIFQQARSYHDGIGVPVDLVKAIELYKQAAEKGNTDAKLNLGYIYFTGQGGVQDYGVARQYYVQAARKGNKSAQQNLGLMYEHGLGVIVNPVTAKAWYDKSNGINVPMQVLKPEVETVTKTVTKTVTEVVVVTEKSPKIELQEVKLEALKEIVIPAALLEKSTAAISQIGSVSHSPSNNIAAGLDVLTATVTGATADAAQTNALVPLGNFRPQQFDVIRLPQWVGSLVSFCLLLAAVLSAIWFGIQVQNIRYQNAKYKFTSIFFERHRESLRGSYLRTPEAERSHNLLQQPWAVSLCTLMVRFAVNQQADPNVKCQISKQIMRRLNHTPYMARKEVFGFIPAIQDRLYFDIASVNAQKNSRLKPYQFDHSKFFLNKSRKNKLQ